MGLFILRGITTALLVTVLTLFAGVIWGAIGLGGLSTSRLLDIGLLASCLVGGYRTAKESGVWLMGGVTGAGYVTVGTLLLALFLPIQGWGFIQVLVEGALIGLVAGAFGAGRKREVESSWNAGKSHTFFTPSYASCGIDDHFSSKFDWETEPISKDDFAENQGAKRNPDEGSDIEWPWDRENKNKKSKFSSPKNSGISQIWESEPLDNDLADWARGGEDKDKAGTEKVNARKVVTGKVTSEKNRDSRPWWEQ
ncbi:TIGR04086 family membrane protein [Desulfosporosinus burensis]